MLGHWLQCLPRMQRSGVYSTLAMLQPKHPVCLKGAVSKSKFNECAFCHGTRVMQPGDTAYCSDAGCSVIPLAKVRCVHHTLYASVNATFLLGRCRIWLGVFSVSECLSKIIFLARRGFSVVSRQNDEDVLISELAPAHRRTIQH